MRFATSAAAAASYAASRLLRQSRSVKYYARQRVEARERDAIDVARRERERISVRQRLLTALTVEPQPLERLLYVASRSRLLATLDVLIDDGFVVVDGAGDDGVGRLGHRSYRLATYDVSKQVVMRGILVVVRSSWTIGGAR